MSQVILSTEQKEKTAQLVWTAFILMFFLIQAIIWTVAISITANDHSHAVVAGYDEKALRWDDEKAAVAASNRLGWTVQIMVDPASDIDGLRAITLQLEDGKESPVTGATVTLAAFHRARVADQQQLRLTETEPGVYVGHVQVRKSGLWQFQGEAHLNKDTYRIAQRQTINAGN